MAATVTHRGATLTTTAGNKTVTATPAANDLIVVITAATGLAGGTSSVTDNQGGTYTKVDSDRSGFSTTGILQMWVRTALIPSAISTIFTANQASSTGGGLSVISVSGMSLTGASAVRSSGGQSSGTLSTTPAPVLSLTPLSSNPIITAIANGSNTLTTNVVERTGYTEDFDNGYNTPPTGMEVSHRASGETSATITYGGTTPTAFASIAIELQFNTAPTTVLNTPADTATGVSTTPTLDFTGTDADSDTVEYEVELNITNNFSLTRYFKFDENTGSTVNDTIGNGSITWQGTLGSQWGTGMLGSAGVFNGTDNYLIVNSGFLLGALTNASFCAWIKTSQFPVSGAAIYSERAASGNDIWKIEMNASGALQFTHRDDANTLNQPNTTTNLINGGGWVHIAVIKTGTAITFYINGVQKGSGTLTGTDTLTDANPSCRLGTDIADGAAWLNGSLDEVILFSRAISTTDLGFIYNSGTGRHVAFNSGLGETGFTAGHPFASAAATDYVIQAADALANSTTYFWRVRAIDPTGRNIYGAYTTAQSFTTAAATTTSSSSSSSSSTSSTSSSTSSTSSSSSSTSSTSSSTSSTSSSSSSTSSTSSSTSSTSSSSSTSSTSSSSSTSSTSSSTSSTSSSSSTSSTSSSTSSTSSSSSTSSTSSSTSSTSSSTSSTSSSSSTSSTSSSSSTSSTSSSSSTSSTSSSTSSTSSSTSSTSSSSSTSSTSSSTSSTSSSTSSTSSSSSTSSTSSSTSSTSSSSTSTSVTGTTTSSSSSSSSTSSTSSSTSSTSSSSSTSSTSSSSSTSSTSSSSSTSTTSSSTSSTSSSTSHSTSSTSSSSSTSSTSSSTSSTSSSTSSTSSSSTSSTSSSSSSTSTTTVPSNARFWVGGTGSWSDNAHHWSNSSGGAPGAALPTSTDDVFFDANSFSSSGQIVSLPLNTFSSVCRNMDWTGALHSPTFDFINAQLTVYGYLTFIPSMQVISSFQAGQMQFSGTGTYDLDFAGLTLGDLDVSLNWMLVNVDSSGIFNLKSELHVAVAEVQGSATFNTNDHNIECANFNVGGTINAGSTTFTILGDHVNDISWYDPTSIGSGVLFNAGTSIIIIDANRFVTAGQHYNTVIFNNTSALNFDMSGGHDADFETLILNPGCILNVDPFDGIILVTNFTANGTAVHPISLASESPGDQFTLSALNVSVSYIAVQDSIAMGSIDFIDYFGTDNGNTLHWLFPSTKTPVLFKPDIDMDVLFPALDVSEIW